MAQERSKTPFAAFDHCSAPIPASEEGKVLYRKPAYLICTDPQLALEEFLQYYLCR